MSVMQDVAFDANGRWIKCVLNAKFIVFHMNFGKYLNLGKFPKKTGIKLEIWQKNFMADLA